MTPANEIQLYWDLMRSLDQAFVAHQGLAPQDPQTWGEEFFQVLNQEPRPQTPPPRDVYMAATGLILHLMYSRPGPEMAVMILRRPESFLRSVLMYMEMKSDRPKINRQPACLT